MKKKSIIISAIIFAVLVIDQVSKIWVKTNMTIGQEFSILGADWAYIYFVENPGMAFGLTFGGDWGKLALSLFRIGAVGFLFYFLRRLVLEGANMGILVSFSLIIAGAMGNIIDSIFYGVIFSASYAHGDPAVMFPQDGGYAGFLFGKVVDMFYFPLIDTMLPEWIPIWGGKPFQFFKPVFNVADSAICVGIAILLLFQRSFFKKEEVKKQESSETEVAQENSL